MENHWTKGLVDSVLVCFGMFWSYFIGPLMVILVIPRQLS